MFIKFTKMHALSNDFMIIDAVNQQINITKTQVIVWANRKTGVGFDQLLLVELSQEPNVDFHYRIFNANGNEVGQCGNGARCLARFVIHYGLINKKNICISTKTIKMSLYVSNDNMITVDMGMAHWSPHRIPL